MQGIFGSGGAQIMAVLILVSAFGCNNGLILSGARVYYAMAKDGLFFKSAAKLHPKYRTPAHSLMMQCVWTCVLCISGSYGQLLDYIIFAVLVFYILTIAWTVRAANKAAGRFRDPIVQLDIRCCQRSIF